MFPFNNSIINGCNLIIIKKFVLFGFHLFPTVDVHAHAHLVRYLFALFNIYLKLFLILK